MSAIDRTARCGQAATTPDLEERGLRRDRGEDHPMAERLVDAAGLAPATPCWT